MNHKTTKTIPKIIEFLSYDDYNGDIPEDSDIIGSITTQIGNSAFRHCWKIIELCEDIEDE